MKTFLTAFDSPWWDEFQVDFGFPNPMWPCFHLLYTSISRLSLVRSSFIIHEVLLAVCAWPVHIEMDHSGACRRWSLKINQFSWTHFSSRTISRRILLSRSLKRPNSALCGGCDPTFWKKGFLPSHDKGSPCCPWLAHHPMLVCMYKVQHSVFQCQLLGHLH